MFELRSISGAAAAAGLHASCVHSHQLTDSTSIMEPDEPISPSVFHERERVPRSARRASSPRAIHSAPGRRERQAHYLVRRLEDHIWKEMVRVAAPVPPAKGDGADAPATPPQHQSGRRTTPPPRPTSSPSPRPPPHESPLRASPRTPPRSASARAGGSNQQHHRTPPVFVSPHSTARRQGHGVILHSAPSPRDIVSLASPPRGGGAGTAEPLPLTIPVAMRGPGTPPSTGPPRPPRPAAPAAPGPTYEPLRRYALRLMSPSPRRRRRPLRPPGQPMGRGYGV